MKMNVEDGYERWLSKFLAPESVKFLKRVILVLGYTSLEEYNSEHQEALDACNKNPENFFSSRYNLREEEKLRPISLINKIKHKLFFYPHILHHYERIQIKIVKQIYSDKFNGVEYNSEDIRLAILAETSFGRSLAYRGVNNDTIVKHLEYLHAQKLIWEHNFRNTSIDESITHAEISSISEPVGHISMPSEQNEQYEDLESENNELIETPSIIYNLKEIIPAPKIQRGILSNSLPEIAREVERLGLLDSANDFLELSDHNLLVIERKVKWNNSLATLVYFLHLLIQEQILASKERESLPAHIANSMEYLSQGKYKEITTKAFIHARNEEDSKPSSKKSSKKLYRQLKTIIDIHKIKKIDSKRG